MDLELIERKLELIERKLMRIEAMLECFYENRCKIVIEEKKKRNNHEH